jgi:excisionase family DNA binding protein
MGGLALAFRGRGGFRVEHRCTSRPLPVADQGASVLIDHAMQMLGVSRRTVYYWIRQGRLRTVRTRLGSQRVLVDSIRETELMPAGSSPETAGMPGGLTS